MTFGWIEISGVDTFALSIGDSPGGREYLGGGFQAQSADVSGLPRDGRTLHVRLEGFVNNQWDLVGDYTYTAFTLDFDTAKLTAPTPGSILSDDMVEFWWTNVFSGQGFEDYRLSVGTTLGGTDLFDGSMGRIIAKTVANLPIDGSTIYIRLRTFVDRWTSRYEDYTFTAVTAVYGSAEMASPAPGSVLDGPQVAFSWGITSGVEEYQLTVGSAPGGSDLYNQQIPSTTRGAFVSDLPVDGRIVFVRLSCLMDTGLWELRDYTFLAFGAPPPELAALVTPPPGSALSGDAVVFLVETGAGQEQYSFRVGTSEGEGDLFDEVGGNPAGISAVLSFYVEGLPADASIIYVELGSNFDSSNQIYEYNRYTYTAAVGWAEIITPTPDSTLPGDAVTFEWTPGINVWTYEVLIGAAQGTDDIFRTLVSGTDLSSAINALPVDGRMVYVRLMTYYLDDTEAFVDYVFTATAPPDLISPVPGSDLPGDTVTFVWSAPDAGLVQLLVGTSEGASDIWEMQPISDLSMAVSGIPTDGRTIYVRLWNSWVGGGYAFNDYTFIPGPPEPAELTSPIPGAVLLGTTTVFQWTGGIRADLYRLDFHSVGDHLDYSVFVQDGSSVEAPVPTDGYPLSVKLTTLFTDGSQAFKVYNFNPAEASTLISPQLGTLPGQLVYFAWSEGTSVQTYGLTVGSTLGGSEFFDAPQIVDVPQWEALGTGVGNLPTDGSQVWARLYSYFVNGSSTYKDYVFTAASE